MKLGLPIGTPGKFTLELVMSKELLHLDLCVLGMGENLFLIYIYVLILKKGLFRT